MCVDAVCQKNSIPPDVSVSLGEGRQVLHVQMLKYKTVGPCRPIHTFCVHEGPEPPGRAPGFELIFYLGQAVEL